MKVSFSSLINFTVIHSPSNNVVAKVNDVGCTTCLLSRQSGEHKLQ